MNTPKLLLSAACTLLAMSAVADSDIVASNNQIGVQAIATHVDYLETGDGFFAPAGPLDSERGNVYGYTLSMSFMEKIIMNNDYLRLEYSHNTGGTRYVGSLIGGPGGYGSVVSRSSADLRDINLRYGTGFGLFGEKVMLTPYIEGGEHFWHRGVNDDEIYRNDYYGLGLLTQYSPVHRLVLSANAMIGHTKNSRIDAVDIFPADLGNSTLKQYGVSADFAFSKSAHANIGVDYTEFKYGMSPLTPIGGGFVAWEPDSTTKYITYKIGVGSSF